MKLRIYKKGNLYYIQRRIFHFALIEWWISYSTTFTRPYYTTVDEARKTIKELEFFKSQSKIKKNKEIQRFSV